MASTRLDAQSVEGDDFSHVTCSCKASNAPYLTCLSNRSKTKLACIFVVSNYGEINDMAVCWRRLILCLMAW